MKAWRFLVSEVRSRSTYTVILFLSMVVIAILDLFVGNYLLAIFLLLIAVLNWSSAAPEDPDWDQRLDVSWRESMNIAIVALGFIIFAATIAVSFKLSLPWILLVVIVAGVPASLFARYMVKGSRESCLRRTRSRLTMLAYMDSRLLEPDSRLNGVNSSVRTTGDFSTKLEDRKNAFVSNWMEIPGIKNSRRVLLCEAGIPSSQALSPAVTEMNDDDLVVLAAMRTLAEPSED